MQRRTILKILSIVSIIGILFALYLTNENVIISAIRTLTNKPHEVTISNISSNSITIFWYTKHKDKGYVYFRPADSTDTEVLVSDDRVTTTELFGNNLSAKFYTHHVTLKGLTPQTKYSFSLSNGFRNWDLDEVVSISESTKQYFAARSYDQFFFETGSIDDSLSNPSPLMGLNVVQDKSGEFYKYATDSLVYIEDGNGNTISTPADSLGYWVIDVSSVMSTGMDLELNASSQESSDTSDIDSGTSNNEELEISLQNENLSMRKSTDVNYADYRDKRLDLNVQVSVDEDNNGIDFIPDVEAASINCNQNRPNKSVSGVVGKSQFDTLAKNWVNGRGKNYVNECYNDVVCTAMENGIDVGFALWVWLHESAGSNYTAFNQEIEDFGIHSGGVPGNDFTKQINYFVNLSHGNPCSNLDYWTGWATNYLNGSCDVNEKNFYTGQTGPEYLAELRETYSWVSSKGLPSKIKGSADKNACGGSDGGDGGGSGSCKEACPGSDGVLRSCTPPEADGSSNDSLCNRAGRVESCGGVDYCCPSAGGTWTKDMTGCPDGGGDKDPESFTLKVSPGVSLISFPYRPVNEEGETLTSLEFMEQYSSADNDKFEYIARYYNGVWEIFSTDDLEHLGVGVEFALEVDEGYLVKVEDDIDESFTLELEGIKEDVKYDFIDGWNLIGMGYGVNRSATSFIEDNIDISAMSYWDGELGLYRGVVVTSDDDVYGDKFNVKSSNGYFARYGVIDDGGDGDYEVKGRCCRLTISNGKVKLDWEDEIPPCEVAWEIGRNIYDGTLEAVSEVEGKTKATCN